MKTKINILLILLFSFSLNIKSQSIENDWCVVMAKSDYYGQSWAKKEQFPSEDIKKHWAKDKYITSINYGDGVWALVMSKGTGYTNQRWNKSTEFPESEIKKGWDDKYNITNLIYGDGKWVLVMSKGTGYYSQQWFTRTYFPKDEIKKGWDEGRAIISMNYGNGIWAVVMAKGSDYTTQKWSKRNSFPNEVIKEDWNDSYDISNLCYGDGQWVVVMSKGAKFTKQGWSTRADFPNDAISTGWDAGKDVLFITHASIAGGQLASDYFNQGQRYHKNKEYLKAINSYTKAIEKNSNVPNYYNSKAWSSCFIEHNLSTAAYDVTKAINKESNASSKAAYLDTRATVYALQGYLNKSVSDFNRAINLDAKALYYYKRGLVNKNLNNIESAKADFAKAKSMDYTMKYKSVSDPLFKKFNDNIYSTDNTPPVISITSPNVTRGFEVVKSHKNVTIKGRAEDDSGIFEVLINGKDAFVDEQGNFTKNVLLDVGNNNFTVTATDMKRNKSTKTFTIKRKSNPPDVVVNNPSNTTNPTNTTNNEVVKTGKYYALIIGVQDYRDPSINDLDQPVSDAKKLYDVLIKNYSFSSYNIKFLKNPTKLQITGALDTYSNIITKKDNLLIFYAGHGYWDEKFEQGYWLASDSKRSLRGTWLSNSSIKDYMRGIPAKHSLLITDACFGGGIFKSRDAFANASVAINQLYQFPSRKAMTSGALSEVPDKSVFIEYLVKRLEQNSKKYLSSEQLFASFKTAVINNSSNGQVPQFGEVKSTGDEGGDFIFIHK